MLYIYLHVKTTAEEQNQLFTQSADSVLKQGKTACDRKTTSDSKQKLRLLCNSVIIFVFVTAQVGSFPGVCVCACVRNWSKPCTDSPCTDISITDDHHYRTDGGKTPTTPTQLTVCVNRPRTV